MNKVVFLDRDGTINVDKNYVCKTDDFEFIPGVFEGLAILKELGFKLIIITNQSGIARGYYTERDFQVLNKWMLNEMRKNGIDIDAVYYCPHHPNASIAQYKMECSCRKPGLGLFKKACYDFDVNLSKSYAIGDKLRDCTICAESECSGFLVGLNERESVIEDVKNKKYKNICYVSDFFECSVDIAKKEKF